MSLRRDATLKMLCFLRQKSKCQPLQKVEVSQAYFPPAGVEPVSRLPAHACFPATAEKLLRTRGVLARSSRFFGLSRHKRFPPDKERAEEARRSCNGSPHLFHGAEQSA